MIGRCVITMQQQSHNRRLLMRLSNGWLGLAGFLVRLLAGGEDLASLSCSSAFREREREKDIGARKVIKKMRHD